MIMIMVIIYNQMFNSITFAVQLLFSSSFDVCMPTAEVLITSNSSMKITNQLEKKTSLLTSNAISTTILFSH